MGTGYDSCGGGIGKPVVTVHCGRSLEGLSELDRWGASAPAEGAGYHLVLPGSLWLSVGSVLVFSPHHFLEWWCQVCSSEPQGGFGDMPVSEPSVRATWLGWGQARVGEGRCHPSQRSTEPPINGLPKYSLLALLPSTLKLNRWSFSCD